MHFTEEKIRQMDVDQLVSLTREELNEIILNYAEFVYEFKENVLFIQVFCFGALVEIEGDNVNFIWGRKKYDVRYHYDFFARN